MERMIGVAPATDERLDEGAAERGDGPDEGAGGGGEVEGEEEGLGDVSGWCD